jgi:serine/threonine-protein kinase
MDGVAGEIETIGPYVLTRRLGQGGMGSLYVGHLEEDDLATDLAIKVIDDAYSNDPDYVRAFRREAETASRIDHPNVVQVVDRGEDEGRQFLVMELLHGRALSELFQKCHAAKTWVPAELAVWIMARICEGLHSVHEARDGNGSPLAMVHGDVSPQNIFLTQEGQVKLIDFGLAHSFLRATNDNGPAKVYGKIHYLSPEQAAGQRLDHRSDLFSAGATLYEGLTTQNAFAAASKFLVLLRISQGEPDAIRDHLPEIDPELELIVHRCLAHEPADRFETAESLRFALDNFLINRGTRMTPPDLAHFLGQTFGDAVDATSLTPSLRRRSTRSNAARPSLHGEATPEEAGGPVWLYLAIGVGVGALVGVFVLLRALGVL